MVPHAVRFIESHPKTSSGKVDKLAIRPLLVDGSSPFNSLQMSIRGRAGPEATQELVTR